MLPLTVSALLDDGGREVARVVAVVVVVVVLAVQLAVATPAILIASPSGVAGLQTFADQHGARRSAPGPAPFEPGAASARSTSASNADAGSGSSTLPSSSVGADLVETARRYLGVPYVFGGVNPATGLDCSGLVQLVFRQTGIPLPRTAQGQYDATPRVPRGQLQPGDLVFFARTYADPNDWVTHVGIYIGNGLQINAPTEGQVVSIQPVFSGFWGAHYAGAGRAAAV
jgi:cell wall-associated NlpC family hydrolase